MKELKMCKNHYITQLHQVEKKGERMYFVMRVIIGNKERIKYVYLMQF